MGRETFSRNSAELSLEDRGIEIGTSQYLLSAKAQSFLESAGTTSDYEKTRTVLIINEPHESLSGQVNLYKFLEVFFADNPSLIQKTVFLSEGSPYGEPISLNPLKELEPHPSEETIRDVLGSFLITGYMAYEWKYNHGIPIVGIEDPVLYGLGSRLRTNLNQFGQETKTNDSFFWYVSIAARNESMTRILKEAAKAVENPMLFVGHMHLRHVVTKEESRKLFKPGAGSSLSKDELNIFTTTANRSISNYLEGAKIGYHALSAYGQQTDADTEIYNKLFEIQQADDYQGFIDWLLSTRRLKNTTTKPSPETAAEFLKKLKLAKSTDFKEQNSLGKSVDITTAENLSDKSAKEPHIPEYSLKIQEALFKEFDSRVVSIAGLSKTQSNLRRLKFSSAIAPDLPVFGPRIRKDHLKRVDHFASRFANVPGKQEVIDLAISGSWRDRVGSQLQLDAAEIIGPENIRRFEERHRLSGGINRVDIATNDNVAVECKNFRRIDARDIKEWVIQGIRRFERSLTFHSYSAAVIVISENISDRELKRIDDIFNSYRARYMPEVSGKMWLCRLSELLNILNAVGK